MSRGDENVDYFSFDPEAGLDTAPCRSYLPSIYTVSSLESFQGSGAQESQAQLKDKRRDGGGWDVEKLEFAAGSLPNSGRQLAEPPLGRAKRPRAWPRQWSVNFWRNGAAFEDASPQSQCESGIHCRGCFDSIMKFAKELDETAVPEWRDKYLDYKGAKKKLKAVGQAVRNFDRSSPQARKSPFANTASSLRDAPVYSWLNRGAKSNTFNGDSRDSQGRLLRSRSEAYSPQLSRENDAERTPRVRPIPATERSPLKTAAPSGRDDAPSMRRYGSIIGSPPSGNSPLPLSMQRTNEGQASLLELPDPALEPARSNTHDARESQDDPDYDRPVSPGSPDIPSQEQGQPPKPPAGQLGHTGNAYEVGQKNDATPSALSALSYGAMFRPRRMQSTPEGSSESRRPPFLHRVFSIAGPTRSPDRRNNDIALEAYREVDFRQAEFFLFLDKQLIKIEEFYRTKEEEATERLRVLREQLHILRNRRLEEIAAAQQKQNEAAGLSNGALSQVTDGLPFLGRQKTGGQANGNATNEPDPRASRPHWQSVTSQVDHALDKVRTGHVGKTSKAMGELGTPLNTRLDPDNRDYVRRFSKETVPYRVAKRKLKTALAEYYRGLELLKSYVLLNRTAFRKINKKFDKTVTARPTMRYMSEKIDKAHFVNSDVVDSHIQAVEDLYARYFERGSRKLAVSRLRGKLLKGSDHTGSVFRTGILLGLGTVLGIQGTVYGAIALWDPDPIIRVHTSYLLQIYADYFLMLLLVGLFCLCARTFTLARVNYQFIFEFDNRHTLDWRQLCELPAVFWFLFGLTIYLNFNVVGGQDMHIYWPVVLIGVSAILLLLPPPLFYYHARCWFLTSIWRLSCAGAYPVEFRDFFLGDMFCSETYAIGNIELFFCLYAKHWNDPPQCNSSHSRLLGFFSTLPACWRAVQCLRRYWDTRNVFPHMVNFGKYGFNILIYVVLSMFRIDKRPEFKALLIVVGIIYSLYTMTWDILMDWSLGDPNAKHRFLRKTLAYKRHIWFYYFAMAVDPIVRCNWIFYVIFADDMQHSSIISFAVALSEVLRRGMWTLLRVENEHCTNVFRNRASRDIPLPYEQQADPTETTPPSGERSDEESAAHTTATQPQPPTTPSLLRQRRQGVAMDSPIAQTLKRVGSTLATAHAQDYERRRRPDQQIEEEAQDSEDDEEDDEERRETQDALDRARRHED